MITVDTLSEAEQPWVWRCHQCAVAFVDGAWHRMDKAQWIPLTAMPAGPFFRIDNPVFSDYRAGLYRPRERTKRGRAVKIRRFIDSRPVRRVVDVVDSFIWWYVPGYDGPMPNDIYPDWRRLRHGAGEDKQ